MAKRNRRRNRRANRAEKRAKRIQQKIANIRSGGGNKKQARARVQALKAKRNNAAAKAQAVRKNIVRSGGTVRDRVQSSGAVARRSTPQAYRPSGSQSQNVVVKTTPAPRRNAGRQTTVYGKNVNTNSFSNNNNNVSSAFVKAATGPLAPTNLGPTKKQKRQGYFTTSKKGEQRAYDAGKKFNAGDVRRMKAGGMSQKEIMQYAKDNNYTDSKIFNKLSKNRRGSFDKDGNYDYGKKFNAADVGRMSAGGMGTQAMADFIQDNKSLDNNTFAQDWLKNNQGSGSTGGTATTTPNGDPSDPEGTIDNTGLQTDIDDNTDIVGTDDIDPLETDFTQSQEYLDLTSQVESLQEQLSEYQQKDISQTEDLTIDNTENSNFTYMPTAPGNSYQPINSPTPQYDPLAWLKDYQTIGQPIPATEGGKPADLTDIPVVSEPINDTMNVTPDPTPAPTPTPSPNGTPSGYQPIGAEHLGNQNMVLTRAGYSSGYNPFRCWQSLCNSN